MTQYFELFQLPAAFDIDNETIEQTYRRLAARFHPDKFAAASSFEQKQAVMMAATLNDAYRTLMSPIDRAAYLLKSQGMDADAPEHTGFAPEFLMQQMEWREALEDGRSAGNEAALLKLDKEIAAEQQNLFADLGRAFASQQAEEAGQLVRQGRFLNKLRQEIKAALP